MADIESCGTSEKGQQDLTKLESTKIKEINIKDYSFGRSMAEEKNTAVWDPKYLMEKLKEYSF